MNTTKKHWNTAAVLDWRRNAKGKMCECGNPADGPASQGYFICARCRALQAAYKGKEHRGVSAGVREPVQQIYETKETRLRVEITERPDGWVIRAHGVYSLLLAELNAKPLCQ